MMRQLGLPRKTFYRYLNEAFEDKKLIFEEISREEVMNQTCILKDRLADAYETLREIGKDKSVDSNIRIYTTNQALEAAMKITLIHLDAPARVAKFAVSILDDAATIASAVTMGKSTTGKGGNRKNTLPRGPATSGNNNRALAF